MGCTTSVPTVDSSRGETVHDYADKTWDIVESSEIHYSAGSPDKEYINEYEMFEILGRGSYGYVRRCSRVNPRCPLSHETYAMKILSKSHLRKLKDTVMSVDNNRQMRIDGLHKLQSEIDIIRHLHHENICSTYEVRGNLGSILFSFSPTFLCIVLRLSLPR